MTYVVKYFLIIRVQTSSKFTQIWCIEDLGHLTRLDAKRVPKIQFFDLPMLTFELNEKTAIFL